MQVVRDNIIPAREVISGFRINYKLPIHYTDNLSIIIKLVRKVTSRFKIV